MVERKRRILIVDDDKGVHIATKYVLREKYECLSAYDGDEAKLFMQKQAIDLILLDLSIRRSEEGLEYIPVFKELDPDCDIIIVSSNTELNLATKAMKAGASAYLLKDHSDDQLILTIESVFSRREVVHENQHYVRDRKRTLARNQIVGESPQIKQLLRDIEKVRRTNANVIITGETGTGKELVARHIGEVEGRPFVAVDSATITHTMAESILFGHEKGSFTGAIGQAKGLFEEANGGTIYFDEIVNMPLEIQSKILRVLQEKEVTRVGSTKVVPLEFRVICATNKDLEKLIAEGKFKEDLYQRLNVISLRIPPLRERISDVPVLIKTFFERSRYDGSPKGFSPAAMDILMKYSWPGNIRELANLVANLCAMVSDQELIEVDDLPQKIRDLSYAAAAPLQTVTALPVGQVQNVKESLSAAGMDFYKYMHSVEGQVLKQLYDLYGGNVTQMSKSLNISRSHLYSKLSVHRILV